MEISAIPNNNNEFMSFKIGHLKDIDSYAFSCESLGKLVENLYDTGDKFKNFHHMTKNEKDHMDLLCRKGFYPYEWVDRIKKLDYEAIPPIEAFQSQLKHASVR